MSWVDEDTVDAVESTELALRENNIGVRHLRVGRGLIKEPVEALESAATYSFGTSYHSAFGPVTGTFIH